MRLTLRKPCNNCPFRRNAAPGWLGPWSPTDLLLSLAQTPFPCHQTIPEGGDGIPFSDDRLEGCAGAAIFLNNKIELSRARETAMHQAQLKDAPDETTASVFTHSQEFIDHHSQPVRRRKASA